jgi:enamine deaminase RidA (YjgF/YER057c/UK114 family)
MTYRIINPEELGRPSGWNHGLLAPVGGRLLFVAGQTARDPSGEVTISGFVQQFERALEGALAVVREAGGGPEHIGRLNIYVTDLQAYLASRKELGVVYRRLMEKHYPAMVLLEVKGLADEGALVEIEATAVVP